MVTFFTLVAFSPVLDLAGGYWFLGRISFTLCIGWVELNSSYAIVAFFNDWNVSLAVFAVLAVFNFRFSWRTVYDIALSVTNLWGHLDNDTIVGIVTAGFNLRR